MNIVVINASPRKEGAVSSLVDAASRSASEKGAAIERLDLAGLNIRHCSFCMACYRDPDSPIGKCPLDDDMKWILPKLKAADGFIIATQVSSGHANAIFKTFFERCAYTAGSSKGKLLWIKGLPVPRFIDRRRFAVTIAAAGGMPAWLRMLCDIATSQMKELAKRSLNARVVGTLYAGEITHKGLKQGDILKAGRLGENLVSAISKAQQYQGQPTMKGAI